MSAACQRAADGNERCRDKGNAGKAKQHHGSSCSRHRNVAEAQQQGDGRNNGYDQCYLKHDPSISAAQRAGELRDSNDLQVKRCSAGAVPRSLPAFV